MEENTDHTRPEFKMDSLVGEQAPLGDHDHFHPAWAGHEYATAIYETASGVPTSNLSRGRYCK